MPLNDMQASQRHAESDAESADEELYPQAIDDASIMAIVRNSVNLIIDNSLLREKARRNWKVGFLCGFGIGLLGGCCVQIAIALHNIALHNLLMYEIRRVPALVSSSIVPHFLTKRR